MEHDDAAFDNVALEAFPFRRRGGGGAGKRDFCRYFPPRANATPDTCQDPSVFDLDGEKLVRCKDDFVYDNFEMKSTVVTEWDLVCQNEYKVCVCVSAYGNL